MEIVLEFLVSVNSQLSELLGWPSWAMGIVAVLLVLVSIVTAIQTIVYYLDMKKISNSNTVNSTNSNNIHSSSNDSGNSGRVPTKEFRLFQLQYLGVYLIIMLADWLQGTHMYTLYSSYNVNVGTLFLTGFLSSAFFGTFLGMYVDTWGRKLGCITFCLLEIVINLLEHIPWMPVLIFGRILGGLSTSLLFTAFESWMVSIHRKRGFPEEWLSSTFAISSWGNGFVAIIAGFLAQKSADLAGDIGPFQLAIFLTIVSLFIILTWEESRGDNAADNHVRVVHENEDENIQRDAFIRNGKRAPRLRERQESNTEVTTANNKTDSEETPLQAFITSMKDTVKYMVVRPPIMCLGLSQAFFEGGVFTFVFMWVPSLIMTNPYSELPTGLIFSAFMLSMTIGGMLFGLLLPIFPYGVEGLCLLVYIAAALAMAVPVYYFNFWSLIISFLALEAVLGMFNSCGGTLRSQLYPEAQQSSIMSVFRLPLNLLVAVGTKLADSADTIVKLQDVFFVVVCMHVVAAMLHFTLMRELSKQKQKIN